MNLRSFMISIPIRDCAIITWGRVGKLEAGCIGENDKKTEGGAGLEVKFNIYRWGITFSFLFANWKSSGGAIKVQI